jgi:Tfp pilus assembly protein PilF
MTSQHRRRSAYRQIAIALIALPLSAALSCGCGSSRHHEPRGSQDDAHHQSAATRAEQLSSTASALLLTEPQRAETLLRQALALDPFCGPAHNNLGVLLLNRGTLNEAAIEFESARKLMPSHPDPRLNLAITFERAGRIDDAMKTYRAALEVAPTHITSILGLTRLELLANQIAPETRSRLEFLALSAPTPAVRNWARDELLRLK